MIRFLKLSVGALAAAGLLAGASSAAAAVLYDNGPLNGSVGSFTMGGSGGSYAVSDSFALNAASTIAGVNFGAWTFPGDMVSTVDWGITTTPGSFSGFIYGGTAAVVNGLSSLNSPGWSIATDSFSTGPLSLGAGVYYLVLQNAVATNNDAVYWDESDGLSSAAQNIIGDLADFNRPNTTGSESFQIIGSTVGGVPEPASWALMLIGVAGLGGALRAARKPRSATPSSGPGRKVSRPHPA
jgi:hypothetical protein